MKIFEIETPNKIVNSLVFAEETGCSAYITDGQWYVSGCDSLEEANRLIAAHNWTPPAPLTIEQKLASVGLNLDDLKAALGL